MNASDRNGGRRPSAVVDSTIPITKAEPVKITPLEPIRERNSGLPTKPSGWAALILATCAMAVAIITSIWCLMPVTEVEEQRPLSKVELTVPVIHEHDWVEDYEIVHHDAMIHEETVAPVYEAVIEYHTVCNECNEPIDGAAREHIEETGHNGYSTNVPITVSRLVTEGRIDIVEDSPAFDESVVTGRHCSICGEVG